MDDIIELNSIRNKKKPFIITSIREPISRTISAFFQALELYMNKSQKEILKLPLEEIEEKFREKFMDIENGYSHREMTAIDIMELPFDKSKGYGFYENEKVKILVLMFSRIQEWKDIIEKHLDDDIVPTFSWSPCNISNEKWYSHIYEHLKKTKFSKETLDAKLKISEPELKHFFEQHEIDQIYEKYMIR